MKLLKGLIKSHRPKRTRLKMSIQPTRIMAQTILHWMAEILRTGGKVRQMAWLEDLCGVFSFFHLKCFWAYFHLQHWMIESFTQFDWKRKRRFFASSTKTETNSFEPKCSREKWNRNQFLWKISIKNEEMNEEIN